MSKLDDILGDFMIESTGEERVIMDIQAVGNAKKAVIDLMLELIGDDELQFDVMANGSRTPLADKIKRNELRFELRQRVNEL